ncbi:MAG: hypothetical protein DSZ31_04705 [Gammaproteobacteria bacterium]|nr:MAG: hypothetical protein DSZ31_04705 [Gammaproteobacteria bacterium]RTZ68733.1 MAG: hypothetical protein DSZ30_03750 [Aquificaceae bacterium]
MFLLIKNFGILKNINLELKKVTVITGLNDTGKSSIVKLFFSLIKADNLAERKLEDYVKERKAKIIEQLKGLITQKDVKLVNLVDKQRNLNFLKQFFKNDKAILELLRELELFLDKKKALNERRNRKFYRILTYNFGINLSPFIKKDFVMELLSNRGEKLYSVFLEKDKFQIVDYLPTNGSRKIKPIRDVTYIETPLLMNIAEFLKEIREKSYRTETPFPFVFQDLARKILNKDRFLTSDVYKILEEISKTINGKFLMENGLYFERNSKKINVVGVASGIKAFGILIRLIQTKAIQNGRDFLIIDEPEVHLHPEWQIKYVEILIELIKVLNFNVIVSTHSPYIVQAFAKLGKDNHLENEINFYLIDDGKSFLMNEKLNEIFRILGEPLWKVMV